MFNKMKQTVLDYENEHKDAYTGRQMYDKPTVGNVELVWAVKVLQNWKACAKSFASQHDLFYELTYNGDTDQLYVDVYKEFDRKRIDFDEVGMRLEDRIRNAVFAYVKEHLDKTDNVNFTVDDVYIVWNQQDTLSNKPQIHSMVSTTLPDGMYYDVFYDNDDFRHPFHVRALKKYDHYTIDNYTKE